MPTLTCQSEHGKLHSVWVKKAVDAFRSENLIESQWRSLNYTGKPDLSKALDEYDRFLDFFVTNHVNIHYFPAANEVGLDSIYCRDASIATDHGMVLCNMGKPKRKTEPEQVLAQFKKQGIPVLGSIEAPGTIEGGDTAWVDTQTLAVGLGYRTNKYGLEQIRNLLKPFDIEVLSVELPHYKGPADCFHLMSIFSPVAKDLAVVYSPLMSVAFRNELLDRGYSLIEVPEEEFLAMGCNVLALGPRKCLMVQGHPKTCAALREVGCTVYEYEAVEISLKGGGGPTCLTRPTWREADWQVKG